MRPATDDNFAEVVLPGVAQNGFVFRLVGEGRGFGTQLLGQPQRAQNGATLIFRQAVQLGRFDIHRVPDAAKLCRQPGGGAHQLFIAAAVTDAQQNGIAGMPHFLLTLLVAPGPHLIVDPIGGAAQGQLAQGN
ncbi:hypothetical protein D3C75_385700 [compost metagenome]